MAREAEGEGRGGCGVGLVSNELRPPGAIPLGPLFHAEKPEKGHLCDVYSTAGGLRRWCGHMSRGAVDAWAASERIIEAMQELGPQVFDPDHES